jgi:hypothetical protein
MRSGARLAAALLLLAGCDGTSSSSHGVPSATTRSTTPSTAISHGAPPRRAIRVSAAQATWRLPLAVARAALTDVGGDPRHTLLAGGMLTGDTSTDRVSEIDPTNGHSTPGPPLVIPVHDAAAGTYAGHPAVYGGGNSTEQSAVQALVQGRWRQVGHLPTTRSDLSVVTVEGRSIVVGGYDGASVPRSILNQRGHELRPQGHLAHGVRYAAAAVVGHDIYVLGGEVGRHELGDVQRVDARTGQTTVVARLPRPLGHAAAAYVGGRVLLMGGRIGVSRQTAAMWWFDPSSDRFTPAGHLPVPLSDSAVVTIGHRIWLLGGESPRVTDRVMVITVS